MRAAEWDAINRDFILDRMIPYLDATAPYVEGVGGGETATGMSAIYKAIGTRDQFRNLVRTNRLFKEAQRSVYRATLAKATTLRAGVAAELARGR